MIPSSHRPVMALVDLKRKCLQRSQDQASIRPFRLAVQSDKSLACSRPSSGFQPETVPAVARCWCASAKIPAVAVHSFYRNKARRLFKYAFIPVGGARAKQTRYPRPSVHAPEIAGAATFLLHLKRGFKAHRFAYYLFHPKRVISDAPACNSGSQCQHMEQVSG